MSDGHNFSRPQTLSALPQSGLEVRIEAKPQERDSIAAFLDLPALDQLTAELLVAGASAIQVGNGQTLTVAVRSLAMRDLTAANAARIVWREAIVGGVNGVMFAVIMGGLAGLWNYGMHHNAAQSALLGVVIGAAMIVNLVAAGLAGILIPLGLQRAGADPAVSSAVFVTTVTDVVGFFVFLGLAALVLL